MLWCCALSAPARAEVIVEVATIGPGDAVWERYGHVVLRIANTRTGHDDAYDLGAADFGLPGFAWDFANGRERFFTTVSPWSARLERFRQRDREVSIQRLALDAAQLERLRGEVNTLRAQADTHFYVYDHVRDNCSTRLRDLLDRVTDGALRRASQTLESQSTYRDLTLAGQAGRIDALLFLDLIIGPPYDRVVSGWELLFLPRHLAEALAGARVPDAGGDRPLVASAALEYPRSAPAPQQGSAEAGRRLAVGFGLACLGFCVAARIRPDALGGPVRALQVAVGLLFGTAGVGLWTLIAFSRVPDLSWSENALLFLPTDLALLRNRRYLDARLALLAVVVGARLAGLLQQETGAFLICAGATLLGLRLAPRRRQN